MISASNPLSFIANGLKTKRSQSAATKENQNPQLLQRLSTRELRREAENLFSESFEQLERWVQCGESEVYLRKLFNLEREGNLPGYSISTFDFIVFFKNHDMSQDHNKRLAYAYKRRLILSDFQTRVLSNLKYQGFHKRHDSILKIWNKFLRVVGLQADCPQDQYQCTRMSVIRQYMQFCQSNQQSKTQQLKDLTKILHQFWLLELEQEKSEDPLPFSMLRFSRLWKQRYNNDSRIVVNTSQEQMEQRQMYCNSANTLDANFDHFQKRPATRKTFNYLMENISAFVLINNSRHSYNCAKFQTHPQFRGANFDFSLSDFNQDLMPYVRRAVVLLSRVSNLQQHNQLSLYESFWDVTFLVRFLQSLKVGHQNNVSVAEGKKRRILGEKF